MRRHPDQRRREDPLDLLMGPQRVPARDTAASRRNQADPARCAKRFLISFCVLAGMTLCLALLLRWSQKQKASRLATPSPTAPGVESEPGIEILPTIAPAPIRQPKPRIEVTSGPPVVLTTEAPEVLYLLTFDGPPNWYIGGPLAMRQLGRRQPGPAMKDGKQVIDGLVYQESIIAGSKEPLENKDARAVELLSRVDEKARWIDIRLTCRVPVQITSHERFNVRLIDLPNHRQIARPCVVPAGQYYLALEQIVSPDEAAMLTVQHRYKDAWRQQKESIKTLEVTALRRAWTPYGDPKEKITEVEVIVDLGTDQHKTHLTDYDSVGGRITGEEEVGRARDYLWDARGSRGVRRDYELHSDEDPDMVQLKIIYLEDCLSYLQRAYLPAHLTFKAPMEMILVDQGPSLNVPGGLSLTFETFIGIVYPRHIVYEVHTDESGTRIHEMRHEAGGRLFWRITNSNFRRIDGIWVAFQTQFEDFPGGAPPAQQADRAPQGSMYEIRTIRFNRQLTPEDFEPKPGPEDRVIDRRQARSAPGE